MLPKASAVERVAVILSVVLLGCAFRSLGAQNLAVAALPDAPAAFAGSSLYAGPMGGGVMLSPGPAAKKKHRIDWLSPMALSWYALAAGETFDMVETHRTLSHPQWLCGTNPRLDGTTMNAETPDQLPASLVAVCGLSPGGQIPNYGYETSFQESGWTTQLGLASPRNFGAVLGWNLGLDLSQTIVPALFRHRLSGRTILMSELTNVAHAAVHVYGGITNIQRLNGPEGSANTYFQGQAALTQQFPGPRWWGKR